MRDAVVTVSDRMACEWKECSGGHFIMRLIHGVLVGSSLLHVF